MLNPETKDRMYKYFESNIDGGTATMDFLSIIECAIEDQIITIEQAGRYEPELAEMFDDSWFSCPGCMCTMPMDCLGYHLDDGHCRDCEAEISDVDGDWV